MSEAKKEKLERIIEASLLEAKKKAKEREKDNDEDEDDDDETTEDKEQESDEKEADEDNTDAIGAKKFLRMKKGKKDMKESMDASLAAASLHPAAKSIMDTKALSSKTAMMNQVLGVMAGKSGQDMVSFYDKVMSQFGPGMSHGLPDHANEKINQNSIDSKIGKGPKTSEPMPHIDSKGNSLEKENMNPLHDIKFATKEDVEGIFAGEELSEEFKEKATVLFEAAVGARVTVEMAKLEEEYEEAIVEQITEFSEQTLDKLDAYLDYVVEEWMNDNEVAIESALRNEIAEEFIDGLKTLFAENYIEVPESKVEVIEALAEKVSKLETLLDETITENAKMKEVISEVAVNEIIEDISSNLSIAQQEKFLTFAQGIEFDGDVDEYTNKLNIIKETYFKDGVISSDIDDETFEEQDELKAKTNPMVDRYVRALTKTLK